MLTHLLPEGRIRLGFGDFSLVETADEGQGAVDQIPQVPDKLAVDLLLKILPGEQCIGFLRAYIIDIKAPDVGGNTRLSGIGAENADALALGELSAFVIEVLRGGHVVQQGPVLAGSEQRRGKDNCVKRDVVLTDKLEELHLIRILPPLFPFVGMSGAD